eukprot:comp46536_c0_seq1/m.47576 comp46536_c0_seq1/g.47576  ORF comp46536_c0_seq1/g.47576 comp46536_c0_seq1/m.47576 type:complete len:178 (-) comp46536_c0_seq1:29-562(-)
MQRQVRMKKELEMFEKDGREGLSCWPVDDSIDHLEAVVRGSTDTPYEGGLFKLDIQIPERYPFEPPKVRFVTPIYHPNIDDGGRICLDVLKMPPKGGWKPSLNITTVLASIQVLLAEPNPDDSLMADIASEYKMNRARFNERAKDLTRKHAMQSACPATKKQKEGGDGKENVRPAES